MSVIPILAKIPAISAAFACAVPKPSPCHLSVSPCPRICWVNVAVAVAVEPVSLPAPPVTVSLPAPPVTVSLPVPPVTVVVSAVVVSPSTSRYKSSIVISDAGADAIKSSTDCAVVAGVVMAAGVVTAAVFSVKDAIPVAGAVVVVAVVAGVDAAAGVVAGRYGAKTEAIVLSSNPIDLNCAIKSLVASFPPKTSYTSS